MKLRTVSWVMLTVLGSFVLLVSFLSTYRAYGGDYAIGGTAVGAVASGRQEVLLCLLVVLRVPLLGAHLGVAPALLQCGIGVAALLLDVSRLRSAQAGHE